MKNMIKFIVLFSMIIVLASTAIAGDSSGYAFAYPVDIRVLLSRNTDTIYFSIEKGQYQIETKNRIVAHPQPGELWYVKNYGRGSLVVGKEGSEPTAVVEEEAILVKPCEGTDLNVFRYSGTRFRGKLRIYRQGTNLLAINELNIEKYLYGVVGKEMGTYAKMEALKAQAVASRSYALSLYDPLKRYDVGVDTSTQVYGGYDAEQLPGGERIIEAVDSTKSEVMYYNGRLVRAFFHSNAGGYTANSENVWGENIPYLRAVPSPFDAFAAEYPVQTSSGWPGNTYHWNKKMTKNELLELIRQWNASGEDDIAVGDIVEIRALKSENGKETTPSGRVIRLDFIGDNGIKSFFRNNIRQVLGLKSTRFQLKTDATVYIMTGSGELVSSTYGQGLKAVTANKLISNIASGLKRYKVIGMETERMVEKYFKELSIEGYGYGHGLGLSQWGARGMATQGYNYKEILNYYYNQGKKDGCLEIKCYYKEVGNES